MHSHSTVVPLAPIWAGTQLQSVFLMATTVPQVHTRTSTSSHVFVTQGPLDETANGQPPSPQVSGLSRDRKDPAIATAAMSREAKHLTAEGEFDGQADQSVARCPRRGVKPITLFLKLLELCAYQYQPWARRDTPSPSGSSFDRIPVTVHSLALLTPAGVLHRSSI